MRHSTPQGRRLDGSFRVVQVITTYWPSFGVLTVLVGSAECLFASGMMEELKTMLQSANVPKGSLRAAGGVTGAARPNRDDGQTAFSSFLRRRSPEEEASTDAAASSSVQCRNVRLGHMAVHQDHEFARGAAMRIEGGAVEMPTVMLYGRENCGPTKQVTYTSRSLSRPSEHNKRGDYLLSPL